MTNYLFVPPPVQVTTEQSVRLAKSHLPPSYQGFLLLLGGKQNKKRKQDGHEMAEWQCASNRPLSTLPQFCFIECSVHGIWHDCKFTSGRKAQLTERKKETPAKQSVQSFVAYQAFLVFLLVRGQERGHGGKDWVSSFILFYEPPDKEVSKNAMQGNHIQVILTLAAVLSS